MIERSILVDEMVYEVLLQIKESTTLQALMSRLGEDIFDEAIEYCALHELVANLSPVRTADGRLSVDAAVPIVLTAAGIDFINSYSQYKRR